MNPKQVRAAQIKELLLSRLDSKPRTILELAMSIDVVQTTARKFLAELEDDDKIHSIVMPGAFNKPTLHYYKGVIKHPVNSPARAVVVKRDPLVAALFGVAGVA